MINAAIDESVFEALKETVGRDYISELVQAFLEEVPTLIAQLRPALDGGDVETFRRTAHSVKSNAATFGAIPLFELARELEYMARENRLGEMDTQLESLEEAYDRAAAAIKELCA